MFLPFHHHDYLSKEVWGRSSGRHVTSSVYSTILAGTATVKITGVSMGFTHADSPNSFYVMVLFVSDGKVSKLMHHLESGTQLQ